jgi:glycosyltransferase involved in cell wall biosynthesis
MAHIAVDLTPIRAGGFNGGVKRYALDLLRVLPQHAPQHQWTLLTAAETHDELACLDSFNARRLCVAQKATPKQITPSLKRRLADWSAAHLPAPALYALKSVYRLARQTLPALPPLPIRADILFCPFTGPAFHSPRTPLVCVIHDLQYLDRPYFFDSETRYYRDLHFRQAIRFSSHVISDSDFTRRLILKHSTLDAAQVITIPINLYDQVTPPPFNDVESFLRRWQLARDSFLLYPANFWRHKNHEMLLTALALYIAAHPESNLCVVCTGQPDKRMSQIQEAASRMDLADRIVFTGFVSDQELSALYVSCRAVIFPSLYEGFGLPLLEAMAFGKPVLCSSLTALPEVAGDAALFFDPRQPREIVSAIYRVMSDPLLVSDLVERGRKRLTELGGAAQMAKNYLRVFEAATSRK